jgi:hypothetical protein
MIKDQEFRITDGEDRRSPPAGEAATAVHWLIHPPDQAAAAPHPFQDLVLVFRSQRYKAGDPLFWPIERPLLSLFEITPVLVVHHARLIARQEGRALFFLLCSTSIAFLSAG